MFYTLTKKNDFHKVEQSVNKVTGAIMDSHKEKMGMVISAIYTPTLETNVAIQRELKQSGVLNKIDKKMYVEFLK